MNRRNRQVLINITHDKEDSSPEDLNPSPEMAKKEKPDTGLISRNRLQEAIIWSEILKNPLSKRRKRLKRWE